MEEKAYHFRTIKAIIGLGNPGPKYERTRHNIGFRVADKLVEHHYAQWEESDQMQIARIMIPEDEGMAQRSLRVIKPTTFMNSSGRVIPFLAKKGIKADEILVVHDELEKPFSRVRLKFGGSPHGHNGLRSIIGTIGKDFWRLQFGIGRPEEKDQVSNYVLSRFSFEEEAVIEGLIDQALALVEGKSVR